MPLYLQKQKRINFMKSGLGKVYLIVIYILLILTVLAAAFTKIFLLEETPTIEGINFCIYTGLFLLMLKKIKFFNIGLGIYLVIVGIYSLNHFFSLQYDAVNVVPLSLIVIYFCSGFILLLSKEVRDYIYR